MKEIHDRSVRNSVAWVPINNSYCTMQVVILSNPPPNLSGKLPCILSKMCSAARVDACAKFCICCINWSIVADILHILFSVLWWQHRTASKVAAVLVCGSNAVLVFFVAVY